MLFKKFLIIPWALTSDRRFRLFRPNKHKVTCSVYVVSKNTTGSGIFEGNDHTASFALLFSDLRDNVLPRKPVHGGKVYFRMPLFYRGAGAGTYWHSHNAQNGGFRPKSTVAPNASLLMNHIARGSITSPYTSLTRSWGVAERYAMLGRIRATQSKPGYVYELLIDDPPPFGLFLVDPVLEVANTLKGPLHSSYQHDGSPDFLLGVVDPIGNAHFLTAPYSQPPQGGGTSRPPTLTVELETLVRTLRDAEILAVGNIPALCVLNRHPVW